MHLTIVVPCYNEEAVLRATLQRLLALADEMSERQVATCLLLVDDGSRDATWRIICEQAAADSRVTGLKLAHNAGHQNALWAGLEAAQASGAEAVVSIDVDLQDDERAIIDMVRLFADEHADIVYGVRSDRGSDTRFKRTTAQAFYRFFRTMGGDVVYNHADFRLMSRRAVAALMAYPERNLFLRGMVRTLGFREAYVYYKRAERAAGESKYPLRRMIGFAWDGITSFSVRPLRLITGMGLVFLLIAMGVIVWALVKYISGSTLPGWTSCSSACGLSAAPFLQP